MSASEATRTRLEFSRMDEGVRNTLREMRPLIARVLPGVLDEFYAHVSKYREMASLFAGPERIQHAKEMQLRHWDMVASAAFDDDYVASVTRIGRAHHRLDIEPRWYIGGYSILVSGLVRAIETELDKAAGWFGANAQSRRKKTAMVSAIVTVALLDMDFAISVYLESKLHAKQETLDR